MDIVKKKKTAYMYVHYFIHVFPCFNELIEINKEF